MTIPDYESMMDPILDCVRDGQIYRLADIKDYIAASMNVSGFDRVQKSESGESIFDNRARWAVLSLFNAGLLMRPRRGYYMITDEGLCVLSTECHVDYAYLIDRYESFRQFKRVG